ncbi:MAG: undecaprenyldiphospho-muramoylpentapeptide beta-N-acetylglucosaminyltransferase [Spirochaetales bacterium]|nr:undecaprenyldiphospho-muramoylpentapeptide beta-N-acetylglucosaminyltransferase [Spirochaetales bacterium]
MKKTIIFTGGGTAGHVFPGLAVFRQLEKEAEKDGIELDLRWMGSRKGMERQIIEAEGIPYIGLPSGKLRRYFSFQNFLDLFNIGSGFLIALIRLASLKPAAIFSKGGYVSVPPVMAAKFLRIPVFAHESDSSPGLATRISSRFAHRILLSLEETKGYFPDSMNSRLIVTGNPVRREIYDADRAEGRKTLGLDDKTPFILVLGGSQGARQINDLIFDMAPELVKHTRILHQMGELTYKESNIPGYETRKFIREELPNFISAADIVISRAGAATLWELAVLGKPMILIPLGTGSSRGDQLKNAEILKARGAAEVFYGEIEPIELKNRILNLAKDEKTLEKMGQAAKKLVSQNSAVVISRMLLEYI